MEAVFLLFLVLMTGFLTSLILALSCEYFGMANLASHEDKWVRVSLKVGSGFLGAASILSVFYVSMTIFTMNFGGGDGALFRYGVMVALSILLSSMGFSHWVLQESWRLKALFKK